MQRPVLSGRRSAGIAGVLAVVAVVAAAEFAAGLLPGAQSLFVAVGDAVIGLTPGGIVALAIDLLGAANRLVLVATMLVGLTVAGAGIGLLADRWLWAGVSAVVVVAAVGAVAGVVDPLVPAVTAVTGPLAGGLIGAVTLVMLLRTAPAAPVPGDPESEADTSPERHEQHEPTDGGIGSRRDFLRLAGGVAGGTAVLAVTGGMMQQRTAGEPNGNAVVLPKPRPGLPPPPRGAALDVDGLSPLLTPNERFYRIDTALRVPRIDPEAHTVRVTGMVDQPLEITYRELLDSSDTEADVHLACVSNEVGGRLVGNARWLGVPLDRLLARAGVDPGATQIVGRAVDGWTGGFPVRVALDGRPALVAVGMNGEPLPPDHGFPVRLVIAGLYGYVADTKWLAEIELTTFETYDAFWVRRGWARHGPIKTQSRIDVPAAGAQLEAGQVVVAGVAWAGERGISQVEVSIDDGVWQPAELAAELAATSWRQWKLPWDATSGAHVLRVRATDGAGETQTSVPSPPRPDGATGHHTIRVTVT